jgi:hypothetical protein
MNNEKLQYMMSLTRPQAHDYASAFLVSRSSKERKIQKDFFKENSYAS